MVKTYSYGDDTKISEHFKASDFQCKCHKKHDFSLSEELVSNLEKLYSELNCDSIHVSSGYRCPDHDKAVGGSGSGKHTKGLAADVICYSKPGLPFSSKIVSCKAQDIGFTGIANITSAYTSTHLDMRDGKKWYGDETKGTSWACNDFYEYYGIPKGGDSTVVNGVDISGYQGTIGWAAVKESNLVKFAILRAGWGKYSKQVDPNFESYYSGAKSVGIPVGAYWYSYATTTEDAEKEAEACIEVLKGKRFEYPIWYDVEEQKQFNLGKDKLNAIIKTFLNKMEASGYWAGLYTMASPLNTHISDDVKRRYSIWVANVDVKKPAYDGPYGMWQYSWVGKIPGINCDVDLDHCYIDYPSKIKKKGLNGFSNDPEPEPEPEPIPDIKMGDKGEDVAWMQTKLFKAKCLRENEIDGSFGRITRGALFEFQYENNLPLTGVCDSVTREKLEAV